MFQCTKMSYLPLQSIVKNCYLLKYLPSQSICVETSYLLLLSIVKNGLRLSNILCHHYLNWTWTTHHSWEERTNMMINSNIQADRQMWRLIVTLDNIRGIIYTTVAKRRSTQCNNVIWEYETAKTPLQQDTDQYIILTHWQTVDLLI